MIKRVLSLLLLLGILAGLAGCGAERIEKAPVSAAETRVFTDDCGREVTIPEEITSFVASGPLSQIVLFAVAPEKLAALAAKFGDSAKGFIPDGYYELPYFGQLYGSANLNAEELAAVHPDLIIDVGAAKHSTVSDMDALEAKTGIPSVHIEATLAAMPDAFRKLGALLGREEQTEEQARFLESVYSRTLSILDRVGDNKVKALYILGEDGLNVLANGSYHAELIDMLTDNLAVVTNPVSRGSGNEVTLEQIALWAPDFILFAPDSIFDTVRERETWKELNAVKNGRYAEVPEGPDNWMGTPPAVQRCLGLIWLTAVLYPNYCDYDVKAEVTEYYRLFYGCTLTDEQYAALTARAFCG